jgi:hypothetical protein
LWITVISVVGGGIAAMLSVWAGAALALRGNRYSLRHERSSTAAERCIEAIDRAAEHYHRLGMKISAASDNVDAGNIIDGLIHAYDELLDSDIGHEAWSLEDRKITYAVGDCVSASLRLHLDSYHVPVSELRETVMTLRSELQNVGDSLRAMILNKRVADLTERDRAVIRALLPGRHVRAGMTQRPSDIAMARETPSETE